MLWVIKNAGGVLLGAAATRAEANKIADEIEKEHDIEVVVQEETEEEYEEDQRCNS